MTEVDSKTIEQFAINQFDSLPDYLSKDNVELFETTLYNIDKLCADNPNAYRLTMPFHKLTFGWQSVYAHGFTWEDFLKDIIDNNYINVRKVLNKSNTCIVFYNNSCEARFLVCLVTED